MTDKYKHIDVSQLDLASVQKLCTEVRKDYLYGGIIYCYTNTINHKQYIEQTTNPLGRHNAHIKYAHKLQRDSQEPIHRAIRKYGIEAFQYSVLEFIAVDDEAYLKKLMNAFETIYIYQYGTNVSGYNVSCGGDIVGVGKLHPNSKPILEFDLTTKQQTARYSSLMEAGKAHGVSDGVIRNIVRHKSFKFKNYVFCYEGEQPAFENPNARPKKMYHAHTLTGEYYRCFETLQEAVKATGISASRISTAINAGRASHRAGDYQWFYYRHTTCPNYYGEETLHLYTSDGKYCKSFRREKDILDFLGIKGASSLYKALKDKNKTVRGYYIRNIKAASLSEIKDDAPIGLPTKGTVVSSYDTKGNIVKTYQSLDAASKDMGWKTAAGIRKAVNRQYLQLNGYFWRPGNEPSIDINNLPAPPGTIGIYKVTGEVVGIFSAITEIAAKYEVSPRQVHEELASSKHDPAFDGLIIKYI